MLVNGANVSGTVTLPNTGAYTTYSTYTVSNVMVSASGAATLEVDCDTAGYDLLWIEFQPVARAAFATWRIAGCGGQPTVSLCWIACSGATGYSVNVVSLQRWTLRGDRLIRQHRLPGHGLTNGTTYFYVVAGTNANGTGAALVECSATPQPNTLPTGWICRDVGISTVWSGDAGDVGFAGSSSASGGTYALTGSGIDIWGTADSFQYAYRAVLGDCTIIARVASQQNNDPWAKPGPMIRETLAIRFRQRTRSAYSAERHITLVAAATSGSSSSAAASGSAPYWLKFVRPGNTFTGYRAAIPITGRKSVRRPFPMATNVFVGLAVTAHNNLQPTPPPSTTSAFPASRPPPRPISAPPRPATSSGASVVGGWRRRQLQSQALAANNGLYTVLASGLAGTNYLDAGLAYGATLLLCRLRREREWRGNQLAAGQHDAA